MALPKLTALTKLKPSKTVLLVSGAVLLVLATFVLGAVVKHQQNVVAASEKAATVSELQTAQSEVAALKTANTKLAANGQAEANKSAQVCSWVKSQQPKYRYVIPPLCQ